MGASSFGYGNFVSINLCNSIDTKTDEFLIELGLFLLVSSLLPAKLLKIISIFGFEGNRNVGVSCLMYARTSNDVRSILATLTLLWFYTFGTQLFLNEDGYTSDKIEAVSNLLTDNEQQYTDSAIFLFFHGRFERMKVRLIIFINDYQIGHKIRFDCLLI